MNEPKEPSVFLSQENLWCCRTRNVNADSGVIEYHIHTGFITQEKAMKVLRETERVFQKDLKNLKVSRNCLFTFTEYLEYWFDKHSSDISGTTKVKYHWIIYHLIFPKIKTDLLLQDINGEYLESVIDACKECCASAEYAVYKLLYMVVSSMLRQKVLPCNNIASGLAARKEPRSNVCIYSKKQMKFFLHAVNNDPYSHRLEYYLALFCGLRPGEILGLTYDNFHPDTGILDIYKQYTKDGSLPAEHSAFRFSYKNLEENRPRSLKIPDLIQEELMYRRMENNCYYLKHPEKEDVHAFCISTRGTLKTLDTLNKRLNHITKDCGLPPISMHDLRDMFVWNLIEKGCSSETIQELTGGFQIYRLLTV